MEEKLIYKKIVTIIDELGAISKDKVNAEQKFKYRGIDQFYNALHPLFAKHGVFTVPEVIERIEQPHTTKSGGVWRHVVLRMKYTFFASDGSAFESFVVGEGLDSGDKATNKAMAIAHKYCLLQVFCVATEDMEDPDERTAPERFTPTPSDRATKDELKQLSDLAVANKEKLSEDDLVTLRRLVSAGCSKSVCQDWISRLKEMKEAA
jgi:hypothetical protein